MKSVVGIGSAAVLAIACTAAAGLPADAAGKPNSTTSAPTKMFLTPKDVHMFAVTAPVKHTYTSYTAFSKTVCGTPAFSKARWAAGAMERFQSYNTQNQLSICGSTYRSPAAAHHAYVLALSGMRQGFNSATTTGANIGNESARIYGMSKTLHLAVNQVVFRHGATLVRLKVLGHKALTVHLKLLARHVNANLGM